MSANLNAIHTFRKARAEIFWRDKFVKRLTDGLYATCDYALQECARPEVKEVKSALGSTVLRFGDPDTHPDQSINLTVRTSKATAIARPPSMKKFARTDDPRNGDVMDWDGQRVVQYAPVKTRTDLFVKEEQEVKAEENAVTDGERVKRDNDVKVELDEDGEPVEGGNQELANVTKGDDTSMRLVTDEDTQIAYKYGSTYIPVDKTDFEPLKTEKGLDILGFIARDTVRFIASCY